METHDEFLKYLSQISVKYCLWSYLYLNDLNILFFCRQDSVDYVTYIDAICCE